MLRFLKIMYFSGLLPVNWTAQKDGNQIGFEISSMKTILMIVGDLFIAMIIPAYICLWHWLNITGFDFSQLLTAKFYMEVNDGAVTTTICQLVYINFPICVFWIYGIVGT